LLPVVKDHGFVSKLLEQADSKIVNAHININLYLFIFLIL